MSLAWSHITNRGERNLQRTELSLSNTILEEHVCIPEVASPWVVLAAVVLCSSCACSGTKSDVEWSVLEKNVSHVGFCVLAIIWCLDGSIIEKLVLVCRVKQDCAIDIGVGTSEYGHELSSPLSAHDSRASRQWTAPVYTLEIGKGWRIDTLVATRVNDRVPFEVWMSVN